LQTSPRERRLLSTPKPRAANHFNRIVLDWLMPMELEVEHGGHPGPDT
jgi:hypothetical protein